ncbi:MAG: aldose epimerase family protein [Paracoccaceae bacterium]
MTTTRVIGRHDGHEVVEAVLETGEARVSVLNYGCVIRDWRIPVAGADMPVVLGFDDFSAYPAHSKSFGIIAGRVANRIANAAFDLGGRRYRLPANENRHTLHGGMLGLGRRMWEIGTDSAGNAVRLRYSSPDGEEGFPGNVEFSVEFRLEGSTLTCEMRGVPDRPTPINLAQHNYYNLSGGGDVRGHVLQVAASRYTPVDAELIPTGEIAPIDGQVFDFREAASIADRDPDRVGFDVNVVLDEQRDVSLPSAAVTEPSSGVTLRLWTGEPGLQLFNAPNLDVPVPGLGGQHYGPFAGLCLESQHFPDSLRHAHFPTIIRTPEIPYYQKLVVDISG